MSLLEDILAAVEAEAGPPLPTQTVTGFGVDLDCADDVLESMALAPPVRALAQAVYRRLITPRGMVLDAPDYGFDLRSLLSKGMTQADLATVPGVARAEVTKDERIADATASARMLDAATLELTIRCVTGVGPFELVLDVTAAAVKLKGIR
jgi:hypothetical protein